MNFYHSESSKVWSEVQNKDFFLTPEGHTSPNKEFAAFASAVRGYQTDQSKGEVLCRFPARTTLLLKEYEPFNSFKRPDCKDHPRYINPAKVTGVSLIFASGYFESPASYFGHTMLKFETPEKDFDEFFFDSSLNYGAQVTDATGNPMYIVNGLMGGYTASFQRNNDFINTYSYTNKDMRDVWEYPLELTPDQTRFLVEYSSELRHAKFKYYFFTDNCAHRMARLIEAATGKKLVDTDGLWLLPVEVVQTLKSPEDETSPLKDELRTPSLKSRVRDGYLALSKSDKRAVNSYLTSKPEEQLSLSKGLSNEALTVAFMQYDVQLAKLSSKTKKSKAIPKLQASRAILLREKLARPAFKAESKMVTENPSRSITPATMKHPGSVQVGYLSKPDKDALNLRFQASNNDLLTAPFEGQEASRFIMGAAEIETSFEDVSLKRVTLLDIASLNTNPLPSSFTGEYSWSLKAEYGPRNNICDKCSSAGVDAKIGKAVRLNEDLMLFGLIGGQVNSRETSHNDILMLTSENGVLIDVSPRARLLAGINIEASPERGDPAYLYKGSLSYDISPQTDIRMSLENDGEESAALLSLSFYLN